MRNGVKIKTNKRGFTILEVFIALGVFSVFATVFLQSQSQNIFDSKQMGDELILKKLCENKMNQFLINPPSLTPSFDGKKEIKNYEEKDYANYSYTIEYKRLKMPDLAALMTGQPQDQEELTDAQKSRMRMLQNAFQVIQKKIEEIFWEVRVTITDKNDGRFYQLATWYSSPRSKLNLEIPLGGQKP